jgi:hypothetical protein
MTALGYLIAGVISSSIWALPTHKITTENKGVYTLDNRLFSVKQGDKRCFGGFVVIGTINDKQKSRKEKKQT